MRHRHCVVLGGVQLINASTVRGRTKIAELRAASEGKKHEKGWKPGKQDTRGLQARQGRLLRLQRAAPFSTVRQIRKVLSNRRVMWVSREPELLLRTTR